MRKKQGFTLIELLAVIVILAVIALIATPIIIGIIEDSKLKAYENSAYGIINSAKYYYAQSLLKPENKIEYDKDVLGKLNYDGQQPKEGSSTFISANGEVAVALLYGNKCYIKEYSEEKLKDGDSKDCKVAIPTTGPTLSNTITNSPIVTTGSGLYKMSDTEYRYRGGCTRQGVPNNYTCADVDPVNNYITINGQKYRIISIDSQGVKVMSEKKLAASQIYDKGGISVVSCTDATCPRNNANNTFCQVMSGTYNGCSVYAAVPGNFTSGTKTGTVTHNSTLYDYLNINEADAEVVNLRNKALSATWNIGAVIGGTANTSISTIYSQEKSATANFKIGLINTSDYIMASLDTKCQTDPVSYSTNSEACRNNNWLFNSTGNFQWTINPWGSTAGYSDNIWAIDTNVGMIDYFSAHSNFSVYPVGYLSSNLFVKSGDGTSSNPWIVE